MEKFQKIISLIEKTGDKLLILDKNGDPGYVLMSISDYERFISNNFEIKDLTENELLDKINRDVEALKDLRGDEEIPEIPEIKAKFIEEITKSSFLDDSDIEDKLGEIEEDRYYFEPVE